MDFCWSVVIVLLFCLNSFCCYTVVGRIASEPECDCSAERFSSSVSSGIFKSPNFPQHYCNDLNCVYELEPKPNEAISLVVEIFATEASHDYVEVYQMVNWSPSSNVSAGFQLIKQHVLSGTSLIQSHFYSSVGGGLRLVFITDATENEYSGFQMSFQRFPSTSRRHVPCPSPVFHMAQKEVRTLPVLTSSFTIDSSCAFQINSTEAIEINVKTISSSISLKIYETESFHSKLNTNYLYSLDGTLAISGLSRYGRNVTSRSSSIIVIVSFEASLRLAPQVYSIEFRRATSICACPAKSISIKPGLIALFTSPGYPLEYCNDLNCTSEVVVQSPSTNISYSSVVRAKLNGFFIMEADVDYLQMIDKKALIALSGHAQKINYFTFDHHQVGLSFVTDHSVAEGGFNISLEVYSKPYYCMCPGTPQMLQDLNHTHDYTFDAHCAYMDCFWQIRPPLNFEELDRDTTTEEPPSESLYRILLNVGFKLQAATEFIEVVNGQFLERNAERTRLDVDMMPEEGDQQQRSFSYENAHLVTLWYHREGGISNQPRSLHIDYQWREKCLCGSSHLTAELDQCKLLTSPDYPLVYCNDLRCEYQIVAEPGLRVVLNVTDFFTEINQDYLFVFEGNSSQSKHIQALSGIEVFSPAIYSQGNVLTLLFTTDVSLSMRGFKLCYKAEMTPEYKLQLAQEESDKQAAASSKVIVWSVVCVLTLLVLLVISIGLFLLYARSKQMMNDSSSGDSSVRFVRGPRTAESHFALINPVFQSILPTRQN